MTKLTIFLTLGLLTASASGCATSPPGDFCDVAKPILPSKADVLTTDTARQILAHDEYGAKACGWKS